jgi:hypothetical protein
MQQIARGAVIDVGFAPKLPSRPSSTHDHVAATVAVHISYSGSCRAKKISARERPDLCAAGSVIDFNVIGA